MKKNLSIALLIVGLISIAFGLRFYHLASLDGARLPAQMAFWLLFSGLVDEIFGFLGLGQK